MVLTSVAMKAQVDCEELFIHNYDCILEAREECSKVTIWPKDGSGGQLG